MSLQNKFLIIFVLLFISLGFMLFAMNRLFILPSFVHLEKNEAIQDLNRVTGAIKKEIERVDDICHDWAAWDDSYEFMKTGLRKYVDSNLSAASFVTANLDIIYYLDTNGEIYWGKTYDLKTEKEIRLQPFLIEKFSRLCTITGQDFNTSEVPENAYKKGLLVTERGPLILAARPILTTEKKGPCCGTLVMGRFLTESLLDTLKEKINVHFNIYIKPPDLSLELKKTDHILVYDSFPSIMGTPAFWIEVVFPRDITSHGIKTIQYSLFFFLGIALVILLVTLMMIQKIVLIPIKQLSQHIHQIEKGDYGLRLDMNRKDVIGKLADSFDKMIARIELQTDQLEKWSSVDSLTGLYNRRVLEETLMREWKRMLRGKKPLTVIMCDIDFFKSFNDDQGHLAGDQCLKAIADTIRISLKRPSDFAARYGGDEFVILLPDTPSEGAQHIAENIRKKVGDLKIEHGKSRTNKYITLSLGVASFISCQGFSPMDLIEIADQALYEVKKGRNAVFFKDLPEK